MERYKTVFSACMNTLCEPDWYWCWPLIGRKWSRDLDAGLWLADEYCVSLSVKVSFCECLSNDRHFILKFTRSISAAWCLYKSFQVSNATCHSMQLSPAGVVGRWFECLDMIFVIIRLLDMKWCCIFPVIWLYTISVHKFLWTLLCNAESWVTLDQSEASVQVTWSLSTNQRPVVTRGVHGDQL